jgi:hypothetical protein
METSADEHVEHIDRRSTTRSGGRDRRSPTRNILFSAVSSGTLASAVVGLLFVAIDSFRGDPFFTPSLIGTVVFLGEPAAAVIEVRTDMMAFYTIIHVLAFVALGGVFTLLYHRVDHNCKHPVVLSLAIFTALGAGMFIADAVLYPGIARAIGVIWVLTANALAAVTMAWFIHTSMAGEDPHLPEFGADLV